MEKIGRMKASRMSRTFRQEYPKIGTIIRKRREALGLSQVTLARRMKWKQTRISDIETGKHCPTLATLWRFAGPLKCHVRDLIPASWNRAPENNA